MKSFTDTSGKHYDLTLTIGKARIIRSRFDLDIVSGDPSVVAHQLVADDMLRMDLIWIMHSGDNLNDDAAHDAFDDVLASGALPEANAAFWDEFDRFIQAINPTRAESIAKLVAHTRKVSAEIIQMMMELSESPEAIEAMTAQLERTKSTLKELGTIYNESAAGSGSPAPTI